MTIPKAFLQSGMPVIMWLVSLNCIGAFLLSALLTLVMAKFANHVGLVDIPAGRKNHEGQIPLTGSALFIAFVVTSLLLESLPVGFVSFLSGLTLLVLLGLFDDLVDIRAATKLVVQIAAVALMVLPSDTLLWNLGSLTGDGPVMLLHWAAPVTIIGVVGVINAYNMIDGLDGLAGSLSLIALLWFAAAAGIIGLQPELLVALVFAFCILGFLVFNLRHRWRRRASVFLGDAGSMMLGAVIAYLAIRLSQQSGPAHGGPVMSPVAALWVCALPLFDTASLTFRRLMAGRSPFAADRHHLHHLMLQSGFTVNQVVPTLALISAILGGIGVLGWHFGVPDQALLLGLAGPFLFHSWFSLYGWKHSGRPWHWVARGKEIRRPQPSLK
jgi:UDP-GlcNAc:undecaprenyl-phosphate GlcNAc-1-phosphate transferase